MLDLKAKEKQEKKKQEKKKKHLEECFFCFNISWYKSLYELYEPPRHKTNKMTLHPAKTQISLGIRPVWSESSLSTWRKLGSLATH